MDLLGQNSLPRIKLKKLFDTPMQELIRRAQLKCAYALNIINKGTNVQIILSSKLTKCLLLSFQEEGILEPRASKSIQLSPKTNIWMKFTLK